MYVFVMKVGAYSTLQVYLEYLIGTVFACLLFYLLCEKIYDKQELYCPYRLLVSVNAWGGFV